MKRKILKRFGAMVLSAAMSLSLVSTTFAEFEEMRCPIPEHTHTEDCYRVSGKKTMVCNPKTHEHMASCYDANGNVSCGYSDQIIHKHDASCYDADDLLICDLPEVFPHVHNNSCYIEESILTCAGEVAESHIHSDECYEVTESYVCGLDEDEFHVHTEDCVEARKELICNLSTDVPAHIHDESCYQTKETLICREPELTPHIHNASCHSMDGELNCGLLQVIEHRHDDSCFDVAEDTITIEPQCGLEEHTHSAACMGNDVGGISDDEVSPEAPGDDNQTDETNPDDTVADDDTILDVDGSPVEESPYSPVKFAASVRQVRISSIEDDFRYKIEAKDVTDAVKMPDFAEITDNHQGGDIYSFDEIEFTAPGEYTFVIREIPGMNKDVRYDERKYTLTVSVTDDGSSNLQIEEYSYLLDSKKTASTQYAMFINAPISDSDWSAETKQKAEILMESMSLEEKVGQMFLLHYPGDGAGTSADAKEVIDKYHPGGFIVFAAAFNNSTPDLFKQKIQETQDSSKIPLMISVDEEGGIGGSGNRVVRISQNPQFRAEGPFLSPQELKATGGLGAVREDGIEKAELLKDLGINMNHAPDADVSAEDGYMYGRTWGGDGIDNSKYVDVAVRAMEENGLGTTIKHFPGYGGTTSNTHNGFAVNELEKEDFYYNDLLPFYAGIYAGAQAVMVTHNTVNAFDSENPASLSPAIYKLLREELNYKGLVITDDLNMNAITQFVGGSGQESLAAIQAGADVALTVDATKQIPPVIEAVKNGALSMERINESCFRMLCWKIEHGVIDYDCEVTPSPDDEATYMPTDGVFATKSGSFDDMWAVASQSGGTVKLLKDVSTQAGKTIDNSVMIDLNGYSIIDDRTINSSLFIVNSTGTLAISDDTHKPSETKTLVSSDSMQPAGYNESDSTITYHTPSEQKGKSYEYTVDIGNCGSIQAGNASVFEVHGTLNINGGTIKGNGPSCNGVSGKAYGIINMNGGQIIGFNHGIDSTPEGDSGAVNISGGIITNNRRGVFVNCTRQFTMAGGVITANVIPANVWQPCGAGIYAWHIKNIIITGGIITENEAASDGGALSITGLRNSNQSTTEITGGTICYNKAKEGAGISFGHIKDMGWDESATDVRHGGRVIISGGQITHNTASVAGGGVCAKNDSSNNTVFEIKEDVYIYDNSLSTGNTSRIASASEDGMDSSGPCENNVELIDGIKMTITGSLSENAKIGVTGSLNQLIAKSGNGYEISAKDLIQFTADADNEYDCKIENGEIYLKEKYLEGDASYTPIGALVATNAGDFAAMWELARESGGTVKLLKDVILVGQYECNNKITLDLDGKTITIGGTKRDHLFSIAPHKSLTIRDGDNEPQVSSDIINEADIRDVEFDRETLSLTYYTPGDANGIAIRHHVDLSNCGAIVGVYGSDMGVKNLISMDEATLKIEGGRFTNEDGQAVFTINRATNSISISGGAIVGNSNKWTYGGAMRLIRTHLSMSGGIIACNEGETGGGFAIELGSLNITGGVIAGNKSANLGGGFWVWHIGVTIGSGASESSPVITGNIADGYGGGFYKSGDSEQLKTTISGGTISYNRAANGGGLYHGKDVAWNANRSHNAGTLSISGGRITGNTVEANKGVNAFGGGISANLTDLRIFDNAYVFDNYVSADGGLAQNNVELVKDMKVTVAAELFDQSKIGITGSEGQLVAVPKTSDSGSIVITEEDLAHLVSDDPDMSCEKLGNDVYLMRLGQEYVDVTVHDVKKGIVGGEDQDTMMKLKIPKGDVLGGYLTQLDNHGMPISIAGCVFYEGPGHTKRFDVDTKLDEDIELYTYVYTLSFSYKGGQDDISIREGHVPAEVMVNGADISKLSFADETGGRTGFNSLLHSLDRSYVFYNVFIDEVDNSKDVSDWICAGCDYSVVLDMPQEFKWNVSGIDEDKISRMYADPVSKDKERITISVVENPFVIEHVSARQNNNTKYSLSAIVDGKIRTLVDLDNLYGPGLFNNYEYRYMLINEQTGKDIISALEPFGFAFDQYEGSLVFTNTDSDVESYGKTYTTAEPDSDPSGGWRIPFAHSNTGSSFDRCRMFYLSRPLDNISDKAISMADLSSYGYWTVSIRDYVNEGKPNDITGEKYVPDGGSISFDLPVREGQEWLVRDGYNANVVLDKESNPGYVHIEISDIKSRIIIYCGESTLLRYSVQYCAYTNEIDWDGKGGVMPLGMIDTKTLGGLPTNNISPTDSSVKSIWLDADGRVMTKRDKLKFIYKQRDFEYIESPTLLHCDRLYMDTHYNLDELWIYKGTDMENDLEDMERNPNLWTIIERNENVPDLRELHLTSDPGFHAEYPNDTLLIENEAIIRFVYNTTDGKEGDESGYTSADVTFYDYDITDGNLYSDWECTKSVEAGTVSKMYVNTKEQGINSPRNDMIGTGANRFAFGNGNTFIGEKLINATLPDGKYFNQGNGTNTISGCAFGLVQNMLGADGNIQYNSNIKGPNLFDGSQMDGKTVIANGYSLNFSRIGDNYTLKGVQKKDGKVVDGIGYGRSGDLSRFEAVYDYKPSWSPVRKQIYSNSFWPMDNVYDNNAYGGWNGHDPKFGKTGNLFIGNVVDEDGRAAYNKALPSSDDSSNPGSPTNIYKAATDHNSYFGMRFAIKFTLQPDYIGTLDYCFFGDDDMFVFLDGKQILDIGGVHSSVGEYVDLWDYIEKDGRTEVEEHVLSFFYLERGASGSTCWMRFTIPEARFEEGGQFNPEKFNDLLLTKIAEGDNLDTEEEFAFDIALRDNNGNYLMNDYNYTVYQGMNKIGSGIMSAGKQNRVKLKSGEQMMISHIPVGSTYEITEAPDLKWSATFQGSNVNQSGNTASGSIRTGDAVDIVCTNTSAVSELPNTGGMGTRGVVAIGETLMIVAIMSLAIRRRKHWKRTKTEK